MVTHKSSHWTGAFITEGPRASTDVHTAGIPFSFSWSLFYGVKCCDWLLPMFLGVSGQLLRLQVASPAKGGLLWSCITQYWATAASCIHRPSQNCRFHGPWTCDTLQPAVHYNMGCGNSTPTFCTVSEASLLKWRLHLQDRAKSGLSGLWEKWSLLPSVPCQISQW